MQSELLQQLRQHKIVAIVRGVRADLADRAVQALADGGIRLIEVTMNTESALEMIPRWKERFAGQLRIGAGTVLDVPMAQAAISAGAEFIISPGLNDAVVRYAVEQGIEIWPGTMTPTEITRAWQLGASAVKVFPLGTLGTQYLKDLRAPLGHIPIIAVGGITLDNIHDFLQNGAIAAGLGSNLVDNKLIEAQRFDELAELARRYVAAVQGEERASS
ncbi:MAG: bifunctional 4-hydroxy-2-oxoglutarate aldolase/2-dehydro-3-deoxy-phosphogluconate aldolase [Abitibacteriaceae bacterium]|nr:bifunctional 4-hydroxy-2-oxoglutarate aldolase/2-dehydro-3-deoxy-phosphogluconate aldolase [Abditibacteriaceae bacterium]